MSDHAYQRRSGSLAARIHALSHDVETSLLRRQPREVNMQVPRHAAITPVLREMAYNAALAGKTLHVVFTDGSHPPPFPAGELQWPEGVTETADPGTTTEELRIGLMSMRHPEMDYFVDLYVCRNLELSRLELAESEKESIAFERARTFLSDTAFRDGGEVWVFHSGLEPMIVGFYRAVVVCLGERRRSGASPLVIRPWIYRPPPVAGMCSATAAREDGEPRLYSPSSPGAQLESYVQLKAWA